MTQPSPVRKSRAFFMLRMLPHWRFLYPLSHGINLLFARARDRLSVLLAESVENKSKS